MIFLVPIGKEMHPFFQMDIGIPVEADDLRQGGGILPYVLCDLYGEIVAVGDYCRASGRDPVQKLLAHIEILGRHPENVAVVVFQLVVENGPGESFITLDALHIVGLEDSGDFFVSVSKQHSMKTNRRFGRFFSRREA